MMCSEHSQRPPRVRLGGKFLAPTPPSLGHLPGASDRNQSALSLRHFGVGGLGLPRSRAEILPSSVESSLRG